MGNIFKKIDQVGNKFELNFGESKRLQTIIGALLTLVSFAMIGLASIGYISNYYDTTKPEISISEEFDPSYPKINLVEGKVTPVISFFSDHELRFLKINQIPNYFTILGYLMEINFESIKNLTFLSNPLVANISFIPCSKLTKSEKWYLETSSQNFIDLAEDYSLCPRIDDPSKHFVEGIIVNPPERKFLIEIKPCSLENKDDCAKLESLQKITALVGLPKLSFKKENFEHPITIEPSLMFSVALDSTVQKNNVVHLKKVSIFDSRVDFMRETLKEKFVEVDQVQSLTDPRPPNQIYCTTDEIKNTPNCKKYFGFDFLPNGKNKRISRNYKKILDILGQIGGISKLFLFCSSFIFMIIGRFLLKKNKVKVLLDSDLREVQQFFVEDDWEEKEELLKKKKNFGRW